MTDMDDTKQDNDLKVADPLMQEIRQLKASDPAPRLGGAAKAAILQAVEANAASGPAALQGRITAWVAGFSGGLETLLRPVSLGTLGVAGIAGLFAGGLMTAPAAYAELTPEEELATHYEFALTGTEFYAEQLDEEIY